MQTEIFELSGESGLTDFDKEKLDAAAGYIRKGGLVAFPTETVYGLGGNALDAAASGRIYAAKGRPSDNPLIVHIAKRDKVYGIAENVSETAEKLMDAFWPGPLTLIFRKKEIVPDATTGGLDTVAVRMPADDAALYFIDRAGGFIAAPSANLSGSPSPTRAEHVISDLSGRIDAVIAAGESDIGIESTIVDISGEVPEILRPGFVTPDMIKNTVGAVKLDKGLAPDSDARPRAPGMKYRHYAPKAEMEIVSGEREAVASYINERLREKGETAAVLASSGNLDRYKGGKIKLLSGDGSVSDAARNLYALLRECDEEGVGFIYSESFDGEGMGLALMNRLNKAAGHRVREV